MLKVYSKHHERWELYQVVNETLSLKIPVSKTYKDEPSLFLKLISWLVFILEIVPNLCNFVMNES